MMVTSSRRCHHWWLLPLDPIAKAPADLAQQMVSFLTLVEAFESRPLVTTTTMPLVFPRGLSGYGTGRQPFPC